MSPIALLPGHLVNRIAAGEVVERPASVVKELLENALDAGASRIRVEIEDGGKKLIKVIDNGCGIEPGQMMLAFTSHATSKIASDDDLFAIETLGFRGEALASIASISHAEAVSRTADRPEGTRLQLSGDRAGEPAPASSPVGTAISIGNLFFNTPARRKFLRTTNTELGHIVTQFTRIALAHTATQLTLIHNGRALYELPGGQALRERIGALLSAELAEGLIPVQRSDRGVEVSGLLGRPEQGRAGTQWQFAFVNGRFVRDRFIAHALREAYRGLMPGDRQPVFFVFLKIDPANVDVNVHPAKIEVRFADSNVIHSQVLATVREKLLGTDLAVPMTTRQGQRSTADQTQGAGGSVASAESPEQRAVRTRQAMADFFESAQRNHSQPRPSEATRGHAGAPGAPAKPRGTSYAGENTTAYRPSDSQAPPCRPANHQGAAGIPATAPAGAEPAVSGAPLGCLQVHNSYLVTQSNDGVLIIDQHALHERIIYQELRRQHNAGPLPCQRCLIPETIDVTPEQMAAVENAGELLAELGVLIESFGPRTIAVQGYPALLQKTPAADFLADLLDLLTGQPAQPKRTELIGHLLEMIACKAAVKAGDRLTVPEIENLLRQRDSIEQTATCPHGRPTTISLTLGQLAKQFKRT